MPEPLVYTVEQTAELLATGRTSTYEAIRRGEIPSVRIGRSLRVPRHALDNLLNCHGPTDGGPNEGRVQRAPEGRGLVREAALRE